MTSTTVTLASGQKMPLVGFGLWKVPADKASDIVYNVRADSLAQEIHAYIIGYQSGIQIV